MIMVVVHLFFSSFQHDLVMDWNIMNYLPETASCQVNFGVGSTTCDLRKF